MRKLPLFGVLGLVIVLFIGTYSCKKITTIDNNTVIETPFTLYFADSSGAIYNTNDGKTIKKVFGADGQPVHALLVTGEHVLVAKNNLYISLDNGKNFNHAYDSLRISIPTAAGDVYFNQSMLLHVGGWSFDYATSRDPDYSNYMGLDYSQTLGGIRGSWWLDGQPDTDAIGRYPVSITSLTLLPGDVVAGYDATKNRNFYKTAADVRWKESTAGTVYQVGNPYVTGGSPLPLTPSTTDVTNYTSMFSYGHLNGRLIAIDALGQKGAWYSDDTGRTWAQYNGLPANTPLWCVNSPFEQICLIGSQRGLYKLNQNTGNFEPSNNGLGNNLIVKGIAFKENLYKNNKHEQFIFLATNKGLYMSTDNAQNWTLTYQGNFTAIY